MTELALLRPWWLAALLPVVALWWWRWRQQVGAERWQRAIAPHLLPHLLIGDDGRRRLGPVHLLLAVWVLAVLALAGPSWRAAPSPLASGGALMVVLRTATTMAASDVQPTRLERATQKLADLLARRAGATTGLIVYSGSAHLVMPPTGDERVLPAMLQDLTPALMPVDGDALAEALVLAQELLVDAAEPGSVLVIADAATPAQVAAVAALRYSTPVQLLAVQALGAAPDRGLQQVAEVLDAPLEPLAADAGDVARLARRARAQAGAAGSAPEDAGYYLVPVIALLALAWSRRGWRLR